MLLVAGGAGFIGANFIDDWLKTTSEPVVNVDKLTYAGPKAAFDYWARLDDERKHCFRFVQVSTDEVYGSLESEEAPFSEHSPYAPNSPYAASKRGGPPRVRIPSNLWTSNNYGPRQFPEKLIPLAIHHALCGKSNFQSMATG